MTHTSNSKAWSKANVIGRWVGITVIVLLATIGSAWALSNQVQENKTNIETIKADIEHIKDRVDEIWKHMLKKE